MTGTQRLGSAWRWTMMGAAVAVGVACSPAATPPASPAPAAEELAAAPAPGVEKVIPRDPALEKLNYLHTEGSTIRDRDGNVVQLTGVSWFGAETDTLVPHGLWMRNWGEMLDQLKGMGFNTIRYPFSNEMFNTGLTPQGIDYALNPDLKDLTALEVMDRIIAGTGERGMKVILDQHRPTSDSQSKLWYTSELPEDLWLTHWKALAARYRGNDTVIGADLHNEPAGEATWGSGDPRTDWRLAAERAGNAILETNPYWLIIVEGIEKHEDDYGNVLNWYWMGGSLQTARLFPVRLNVPNRLVYSAHDYGPGVYMQGWFKDPEFPANLPAVWDHHWGYLAREGIAPVLLGEFGGRSAGDDLEGIWQRSLVKYLKERGISYAYWSFNGNSGDTGGLLGDDWRTEETAKVKMLKTYQGKFFKSQAPKVVNARAVPGPAPEVRPIKALHKDTSKEIWTKELTPELHVANKTTEPMDIGGLELRYWFTADGDASKYGAGSQTATVTSVFTFKDGMQQGLSAQMATAEVVADPDHATRIDPRYYVKVTFAPGATVPPRNSLGVAVKVAKKDGSSYYQDNDYSRREYHWQTEWERIGVYRNNTLTWGEDPVTFEKVKAEREERRDQARERRLAAEAGIAGG